MDERTIPIKCVENICYYSRQNVGNIYHQSLTPSSPHCTLSSLSPSLLTLSLLLLSLLLLISLAISPYYLLPSSLSLLLLISLSPSHHSLPLLLTLSLSHHRYPRHSRKGTPTLNVSPPSKQHPQQLWFKLQN